MNIFRQIQSKENKKLNAIFGVIAFGILIAATWLTLSHHTLADKISRWQGEQMNDRRKYFPVLTIFLLALPPLLILLPLKLFLLKVSTRKTNS
jgi:hypothetical protein